MYVLWYCDLFIAVCCIEILKSHHWMWQVNCAETCRSYVKHCTHSLRNSVLVGVTWVIYITMHGMDCVKAVNFRPIVTNWSRICQPGIRHRNTKYGQSGHYASAKGCNLRYDNRNENHVNDCVCNLYPACYLRRISFYFKSVPVNQKLCLRWYSQLIYDSLLLQPQYR